MYKSTAYVFFVVSISSLFVFQNNLEAQEIIPVSNEKIEFVNASVQNSLNPGDSVGWFVGLNEFSSVSNVGQLNYSVDDCVDMAHLFSLELGLIDPENVYLSVSGQPKKQISKHRLKILRIKGAKIADPSDRNDPLFPDKANLIRLGKEIPGKSGVKGYLFYYFSTHGFEISRTKQPHLFAFDSIYEPGNPDLLENSTVPFISIQSGIDHIIDQKASMAEKILIFVDACRERIRSGNETEKGIVVEEIPVWQSNEVFQNAFGNLGSYQAVYFAADRGSFAHEFSDLHNGVMSYFVQQGLRFGGFKIGSQQFVTIGELMGWVDLETQKLTRQRVSKPQTIRMEGPEAARNIPLPLANDFLVFNKLYEQADRLITQQFNAAVAQNLISMEEMKVSIDQLRQALLMPTIVGGSKTEQNLEWFQRAQKVDSIGSLSSYIEDLSRNYPEYFSNSLALGTFPSGVQSWFLKLNDINGILGTAIYVSGGGGVFLFFVFIILKVTKLFSKKRKLFNGLKRGEIEQRNNPFIAYNLYLKLVEEFNSPVAMRRLGTLSKEGYSKKLNLKKNEEAMHWFQKSAKAGDVEAMWLLGKSLVEKYKNVPASPEYEEGIVWINKASKSGQLEASVFIQSITSKSKNSE